MPEPGPPFRYHGTTPMSPGRPSPMVCSSIGCHQADEEGAARWTASTSPRTPPLRHDAPASSTDAPARMRASFHRAGPPTSPASPGPAVRLQTGRSPPRSTGACRPRRPSMSHVPWRTARYPAAPRGGRGGDLSPISRPARAGPLLPATRRRPHLSRASFRFRRSPPGQTLPDEAGRPRWTQIVDRARS